MTKIRTIVLDFDGVLVESEEAKLNAFEDLFTLYPAYQSAMMVFHLTNYSLPRMAKFEHCVYNLMERPGDFKAVKTMAQQFSEMVMHRVISCPDVRGAREFLHEFFGQVPLYISSVTPDSELKSIIRARGIESFFVEVFGDPPWKKSDAIQTIIKRERLSVSEIIFVGDSAADYRTAVEAGVEFVGRDSGLSFNGIDVRPYCDLSEIADVIRERVKT